MRIHPTAIVDPGSTLAPSVEVGPYSVVGPGAWIGERTVLKSHVVIEPFTRVGKENVVYPFAVIGSDPQDRKFGGEKSTCTIGDHNEIRENVTIHRGTRNGGGVTKVGDHNLFMAGAHVAHDCVIENHVCLANNVMVAGHSHVESGVNIGGGSGVHHFTTVGAYAFVGGLCRVRRDVPPFMVVDGEPARVRGVNLIALTRHGVDAICIAAIKDAYRRLYRDDKTTLGDAVVYLRDRYGGMPAIAKLCDALESAGAGVHGRALESHRGDDKRAIREDAGQMWSRVFNDVGRDMNRIHPLEEEELET